MSVIFLFDHRHDYKQVPDIGGISAHHIIQAMLSGDHFGDEREASHVIGHFSDKTLDALEAKTDLAAFPDVQIVLCITTRRPGFDKAKRRHKKIVADDKRRYVLYARNVHALEQREVIEAFYLADAAQAEAIVNEELDHVPDELRRLFDISHGEYLTALAVLGQGYLSAHFPRPSDAPKEIKQALDSMGWTKFVETAGGGRLADMAYANFEKTEDPQWWQKVCGVDKLRLLKALEKEWGQDRLPSELSHLVDIIYNENQIAGEASKLIAQTYLRLKEKLNGGGA